MVADDDRRSGDEAVRELDRELREREAYYEILFNDQESAVVEEDFSRIKAYLDALRAGGVEDLEAYFAERPEEVMRCAGMIRVVRFNQEFLRVVARPDKRSIDENYRPFVNEEDTAAFRREILLLASGQKKVDLRIRNSVLASEAKFLRIRLSLVSGHEEDWSSVLVCFTDLTSEVQAAEELSALVRQKDILLKELEHRVKNNLNIVSNLISLATEQVSNEADRRIFHDAQSRIQSIALIYELLSHAARADVMSCRSYLGELASLLVRSYAPSRTDLSLALSVEDLEIDVKRGVSLGLIVTELLTNCLKYAFPDRGGTIAVSLAKRGDAIALVVADDGVGAPPGFVAESATSLGFQLIELLTQQMKGKLSVLTSPGFRTEIEFPA